jgi:3-hydroxy-9,10-secoandrosta-1,3,5(10)-triene-9,17-dione monooxygenase reductase component
MGLRPSSAKTKTRTPMSTFSEAEFRQAMGQFCTGVVVVTGLSNGEPVGFTAQSFVSLSLDPPLVGICPARSSQSWPRVRESGHFGINILSADQKPLCGTFARSGSDKFGGLGWKPSASGAPIIDGVLSFVDCRLEAEHDAGDHTFVVGRVLALQAFANPSERPPLLFYRGLYGSFGLLPPHAEG